MNMTTTLSYLDKNLALPVVLCSESGHCIEFHSKSNGDDTYTLVALAGTYNAEPEREKCQGPYHSAHQVVSAVSAITAELTKQGYRLLEAAIPLWALQAQRINNQQQAIRERNTGNYQFDPSDIIPEP